MNLLFFKKWLYIGGLLFLLVSCDNQNFPYTPTPPNPPGSNEGEGGGDGEDNTQPNERYLISGMEIYVNGEDLGDVILVESKTFSYKDRYLSIVNIDRLDNNGTMILNAETLRFYYYDSGDLSQITTDYYNAPSTTVLFTEPTNGQIVASDVSGTIGTYELNGQNEVTSLATPTINYIYHYNNSGQVWQDVGTTVSGNIYTTYAYDDRKNPFQELASKFLPFSLNLLYTHSDCFVNNIRTIYINNATDNGFKRIYQYHYEYNRAGYPRAMEWLSTLQTTVEGETQTQELSGGVLYSYEQVTPD